MPHKHDLNLSYTQKVGIEGTNAMIGAFVLAAWKLMIIHRIKP